MMRLGLDGMDQVGKLDAILNEKHRDVVADQIEDSLFGIEFDGEPPNISS